MSGIARQSEQPQFAASEIELIVREVMARLAGENGKKPRPLPGRERGEGGKLEGETSGQGQGYSLAIAERVVTLELLTKRSDGLAAISVSAGAILTPAAKDYLRERGIAVHVGTSAASTSAGQPARLALGVAETHYEPAGLIARLSLGRVQVEQIARVGLVGVVDELTERVRLGGERGVLLTGEAEAAVCLANRISGVRAAEVRCAKGVRRAKQAIGLNLLVLDPAGISGHQIERAVAEFCHGRTECPARFRERLG